jgi:caspase domain-containing protein
MTRYALVIGSQIEGLTGADNDAGRMRDTLRARGFEVDLRTGDAATRDGILEGYNALIASAAPADAAVIYYSGHGLYSANSDPEDELRIVQSIAPTDLRAGSDADFRGITAWELAIKLAQLTAKTRNVTVILDCCHAAQMTRDGAARDLVPRALPHPIRMGFREHLTALARAYGSVRLDPVGNPDAVRVMACGQTESAFEHTNPAGKRAGIFTEALLEILAGLGDTPISWAAIGDAIRARVMRRFVLQRPDVEGPSERQVFSLVIDPRSGLVPVTHARRPGDPFQIHAGWITGASAGDRYRVMPLGSDGHDAARAIATLRITGVGPVTSVAALESWCPGHTALPDDAVAVPIEIHAPTHAIAVIAPDAERAVIARALAETWTLRIAAPDDPDGHAQDGAGDAPPLAVLRLAGTRLTIEDAAGPLFPSTRYPDDLAAAVHNLANLGVAQRIRALVGEHGLPEATVEIAWGVVSAGAPRAMPDHGASLGLGDRIYLRVRNTGLHRRYVHILNIGVRGKVALLTRPRDPAGITLDEAAQVTLGDHHGQLAGLALAWPPGLSRDSAPRTDELFVFVTSQPIHLRDLETQDHPTRGAALTGSALRDLLGQRPAGASRSAAPPAARDAFFVKRLSYTLHPRAGALADIVAFQIDEDPLRQATATNAAAWLASGHAATIASPLAGSAPAATIAIQLGDLIVRDRPVGVAGARAHRPHDLRIDALVCTRSTHRAQTWTAHTLRYASVRDGDRLPVDQAPLFHGPVHDFVDVYLWVSRGPSSERDLAALLAHHTGDPALHDAVTALVIAGTTAPWITAVGASTALARISYDLLAGTRATGLYRTAFAARERFGIGRHPVAGAHQARELAFSLVIAAASALAPA